MGLPCTRLYCFVPFFAPALPAQPAAGEESPASATNSAPDAPAEPTAALQWELTNAWIRVIQIMNQPVRAYVRTEGLTVATYSPGWFHPGASKPDFNTVDVRRSQELVYASHPYVTSDLNPGLVFLGQDLEFNSMAKFFYVNRSLPKHRLTEAEMLEINRLYRIIGRCELDLAGLENPAGTEAASAGKVGSDTEAVAEPGQAFGSIRKIPQQTRRLYGGIAIGVLVLLVVVGRLTRRRSD